MEKQQNYCPKHSGQVYLLALCVPLLIQLIFSIAILGNKDVASQTWFLTIYRIVLSLSFVGIFYFFNKYNKIDHFACGIKNKTNPWIVLICVVLIVGFLFLSNSFISWIDYFISLTGIKVDASIGYSLNTFFDVFLAVVMLAVVPAVVEELVFRGMILNGLRSFGKWPAICLSALAFCLMHTNVAQFPYTFLLGVLFGFVMYETRALWLCMLMHFANNFVVVLSAALSGGAEQTIEAEVSATPIWLAIILFVASIVLAVVCFWLIQKLLKRKQNEKQQPQETQNAQASQVANPAISKQKSSQDWLWLVMGYVVAIALTIFYAL